MEKRFTSNGAHWQETSLEECLQLTEGSGFFPVGTVKEMLEQGQKVQTPYAVYRRRKNDG